jgi:hypothetical protein
MKPKGPRPEKIRNLLAVVKDCIKDGRYRSCMHLDQREKQRNITRQEVLYVLSHGFHEKREDDFDEAFQAWNYAVRGETLDDRPLRIFVSFENEIMMIIITTYEIGK